MNKTLTITADRREVLINALAAEITALYGVVEEEAANPTDQARYTAQLKTAKRLYEVVGGRS